MSDKDNPYVLHGVLTLFAIFYLILCPFDIQCLNVNPWNITPVEIVTKVKFPSDCTDGDGNTRAHLDNWTSSTGSCDRRVCYIGALETIKWQINYDCPAEINFLDTNNCHYVSESNLEFPYCCPYLVCHNSTIVTTTLAPCSDRSPTFSCQFWKNHSNCADNPVSWIQYLYNLTLKNCQLTCGYCTV